MESGNQQPVTVTFLVRYLQWQEGGQLMYIGWTSSEKLLCVQDDGTTVLFNVFGEIEMRFDMGEVSTLSPKYLPSCNF